MNSTVVTQTIQTRSCARRWGWLVLILLIITAGGLFAQATGGATTNAFNFNIGMNLPEEPKKVDVAIRIVFLITLLTVAPSLVMLMTSFTRIIIVFSFLRNALSLQGVPANQILIGFSLFMTFFIMQPVYQRIDADAIQPYSAGTITGGQALDEAKGHVKDFMLRQARPKDVEFFVGLAKMGPTKVEDLPMSVVIPGFILSELRTGFQMGFLLFIPFILVDFVVAIVLMSLGLLFLPPVTISMPLKILLFVLVDGWTLVVRSLALSFGV
jgi:flagellar biosynthetic protein FliP|tara:strand:- start:2815 stop:3621 length:807 start_codon:yes stop_codon:yes gene_type:complete